jgi:hypothetical protein
MLEGIGCELDVRAQPQELFAALLDRRAQVLVYVLGDADRDLPLLGLVRRAFPSLPLIVLGEPSDLPARRSVQELKPTYYGLFPLDRAELSDAVRGALRGPGSTHSRAVFTPGSSGTSPPGRRP